MKDKRQTKDRQTDRQADKQVDDIGKCLAHFFRDRPAAIPITVKSIDDTSNFDEFPDLELKKQGD